VSHKQNSLRDLLKSAVAKSSNNARIVLAHQAIDAPYVGFQKALDAEAQKRLGKVSMFWMNL